MTKWQMLSLIFSSVHFSQNRIFCRFFCFLSILLNSDQVFYQKFLDLHVFKVEWTRRFNYFKMAGASSSFLAPNDVIMKLMLLFKGYLFVSQLLDFIKHLTISVFFSLMCTLREFIFRQ